MVFFEGYAERVGRKTGGGSLAEEKRVRGRDFPLRPCFTVLHRQVTDFPPLGWRGGISPALTQQRFLPEQPRLPAPPSQLPAAPPPPPAAAARSQGLPSLVPGGLNCRYSGQFKSYYCFVSVL